MNELGRQLQDQAFNTATADVQTRQDLFYIHRALTSIVSLLKASASTVPIIQDNLVPDESEVLEVTDLSLVPQED